jgi:hypothetical protein
MFEKHLIKNNNKLKSFLSKMMGSFIMGRLTYYS